MAIVTHLKFGAVIIAVAVASTELAEQDSFGSSLYIPAETETVGFAEVVARDDNAAITDLLLPAQPVGAVDPVVADPVSAGLCTPVLELVAQSGAMIGLSLMAPCLADQRIVISHAGLAVTGQTTATGAHFSSIPALEVQAVVKVRFDSGEVAEAMIEVPEVEAMHRVAIQWQGEDAFQIHAFVGDADYNQPGHFSALQPGSALEPHFVSVLGDPSTDLPLLAEVFTQPSDKTAEVLFQAEITAGTCGREIMGEVIERYSGAVTVSDLVLAMPECDGIGDIVVLKNLVSEMKLAAAR